MFRTFHEVNDDISNVLKRGDPASIFRIDNTAGYVMWCLHNQQMPSEQFFNLNTMVECGMYPMNLGYAFNVYQKTVEIMKTADILGFVDISGEILRSDFIKQFGDDKPIFAGGESFYIMDPGALLGLSHLGPIENPWTQYLEGKKVLVVSTHAASIMYQWNKIDKIWGDNRKNIAPFELMGVVRAPYHPLIDNRQYLNCSNWEDSVQCVMDDIDKYDYDILLTGSTTSSPWFVDHAKKKGKIGIQTGGTIQLFFGLLGFRWTKVQIYSNWNKMYNEHWMYPFKIDEPQKRNQITFLETAKAYWND